mmetsp:Transcript_3439/g.6426  ORF Transcript_3439/g.6426 Transcript_3439/m.6426 type:complete len:252 (-) Transcript_3439:1115-1870(-)
MVDMAGFCKPRGLVSLLLERLLNLDGRADAPAELAPERAVAEEPVPRLPRTARPALGVEEEDEALGLGLAAVAALETAEPREETAGDGAGGALEGRFLESPWDRPAAAPGRGPELASASSFTRCAAVDKRLWGPPTDALRGSERRVVASLDLCSRTGWRLARGLETLPMEWRAATAAAGELERERRASISSADLPERGEAPREEEGWLRASSNTSSSSASPAVPPRRSTERLRARSRSITRLRETSSCLAP